MAPDDSCCEPEGAASVRAQSFSVVQPPEQSVPLVFASPHSGQDYPTQFVAASRLRPLLLRRSEDAFVDCIFAAAPSRGAPLLRAHFPRVYIDPNREPFELDPAMFDTPLPDYVNASSPRVAAGLGTIARVVANGEEVYRGKLSFEEARQRIDAHYFPYHRALQNLLQSTRERFGCYLLVDCHSMPSVGGPMDADPGLKRLDIVLGDCYGTACAPAVTRLAERTLRAARFHRPPQPSLRRRLHHPPLRQAARRPARPADRGEPRALHGRAVHRADLRPAVGDRGDHHPHRRAVDARSAISEAGMSDRQAPSPANPRQKKGRT